MVEIFVLGATLALAAGASGAQRHRRHVAASTLAHYAVSRAHMFVPAPPSPRGASPRVEGERNDVRFVVDLYRLGGTVRTRVSAATRTRAPKLSIARRDVADVALEGPVADALSLLARRDAVWLACDGERVSLSWRGIETNPLLLDAARDAVTTFARMHPPVVPYR